MEWITKIAVFALHDRDNCYSHDCHLSQNLHNRLIGTQEELRSTELE